MSDLSLDIATWAEQARDLPDGPPGAPLPTLLDAIREGIGLRRRLDERQGEDATDARLEIQRRLYRLQDAASARMEGIAPATPGHQEVAERAERWMQADRAYLGGLLTRPGLDPVRRALLLDGFRRDLQWLTALVARLDGDAPPHPTLAARADLDRLCEALDRPVAPDLDGERRRLRAEGERLQRVLLARRVRQEIGHPMPDASPGELWGRRFLLSRLQAEVESEATDEAEDGDDWPREWAGRLADRRAELADQADATLDARPPRARRQAWEEISLAAQGESLEIITLLEELPPDQDVRFLKLLREDLDRLTRAGRGQARNEDGPREDRIAPAVRKVARLARRARNEWQEKVVALRLETILGRRGVAVLENLVLVLILLVTGLIAAEMVLEHSGTLTAAQQDAFAWADLAICSVFLLEFSLKLATAPGKLLYFRRHFVVDFLASIPFGFFSHRVLLAHAAEDARFLRLLRFLRLPRMVRYVRIARPIVRVGRLLVFALRLADRMVRRHADVLNRSIVLFEAHNAEDPESRHRHLLVALRRHFDRGAAEVLAGLTDEERVRLIGLTLPDLRARVERLPAGGTAAEIRPPQGRVIPVEAVVERLVEMTPEQLVEQMGQPFVETVDRVVRMLDLPLVRRLPVVRDLVAHRQWGPAETAALATNRAGHLIQGVLHLVYYVADLQGTVSAPLFLDRLGTTIVTATQRPAKRLLLLGTSFLVLYGVVEGLPFLRPIRGFVTTLQALLGWPVIALGAICLAFWMLGGWFRRIANQASDFCDRVVEAQFGAQTKALKLRGRDQDSRFLAERVIEPELALRASDDRPAPDASPSPARNEDDGDAGPGTQALGSSKDRELVFLHNVNLLYRDYLDGSPFHRNDTKATTQLLGNLALANLRKSHLAHQLREGRRLEMLDLNKAATSLFGGAYLWFNYITRMIVQETAKLLVDYNLHAMPRDRLACAPRPVRQRYRDWLGRRLGIDPGAVAVPDPVGRFGDAEAGIAERPPPRRREAGEFFENVEFTAMDFLAEDPRRDEEILGRYGDQVLELLRRDRRQNVRRAFRSFPLHRLPEAQRTINLFTLYETSMAGGRVLLLPFRLVAWAVRGLAVVVARIARLVREILHPRVLGVAGDPPDTYEAAVRKIHRMRKPAFMQSLWMRARFDVEYLGLPLPSVPISVGSDSLLETDLDYIGATRADRLQAERTRREQAERLAWIARLLDHLGWGFRALPGELARDFPHLTDRAGEAIRALVTACIVDHDDIATLGLSIEGLRLVIDHAADPANDLRRLPPGLPRPLVGRPRLWHPIRSRRRSPAEVIALPCFPRVDEARRRRILKAFRRHRRVVGGWIKVLASQGGDDPEETLRARLREVLLRTDLWSDQIIVMRTIQTLTMLDVHHYCELVWSLGGYAELEPGRPTSDLPFARAHPQGRPPVPPLTDPSPPVDLTSPPLAGRDEAGPQPIATR